MDNKQTFVFEKKTIFKIDMQCYAHRPRVVLSTLDGPELAEDKNNREMYMHACE